ncbi:hypothetical protein AB0I00_39860 [Streptomyces sp. NPDC050803]|uniref:hypothetical protein n=1 Tax=unclassified Streptomyces TaxID=2593676 RepID=UPI00341964D4
MQTDAPFWKTLVFDGVDAVDVEKVTAAFGTIGIAVKGRAMGAGSAARRAERRDPAEGPALRL